MDATACWMGGLWSDALGESQGAVREQGIAARCAQVLRAVGATDDRPLRVEDATLVGRIAARVHDPALQALLLHVAEATRESMHARLIADQVKADSDVHPPAATYGDDKDLAALVIPQSQALWTLLDDKGPYAVEAHTLGLLVALDRMEIAYRLPKRLKLAVLGPATAAVFGVSAPVAHGDAADALPRGIWLGYLTNVASAAGHPVPATVTDLEQREALAWTSVTEAFADKLRAEPTFHAETELGTVVRRVATRLDDGYGIQEKLLAAKR
jgi:hypothetical protein